MLRVVRIVERLLHLGRPDDLRDHENDLTGPAVEPPDSVSVQVARALAQVICAVLHGHRRIVIEALEQHLLHTLLH